jgi:hypothetical protein
MRDEDVHLAEGRQGIAAQTADKRIGSLRMKQVNRRTRHPYSGLPVKVCHNVSLCMEQCLVILCVFLHPLINLRHQEIPLMAEQRRHRGPHPEDDLLFAPKQWPTLQVAVADLSLLLTKGYALTSSLKLVGDRYQLDERQRKAVLRSSCSDQSLARRLERQVPITQLAGTPLEIDGFNLLTTIEAALSGGVLLLGRDGCCRDMASMHGSYRKVEETLPALTLIGECLAGWQVASCRWLLDSPVSNAGRLSVILRELADSQGWNWTAELTSNPDEDLCNTTAIAVSADSLILDLAGAWCNVAAEIVRGRIIQARVVPMSGT